jgi:DNA-binding response OmpR family regulator
MATSLQGYKILIIDDDPDLLALLERALGRAGAEVVTALDGREGLRLFHQREPDLVILDIVLPGLDGWQVADLLQPFGQVPVLLLTALSEEQDVVRGLEAGAVDYVTKPFSLPVLIARVGAALRCARLHAGRQGPPPYDDGTLRIDLPAQEVWVAGEPRALSGTEFRLLAYLVEHGGQLLSHRQILEGVWGWEYGDCVEYVHVYASRLRRKLEPDPARPRYLVTYRGLGYRFRRLPRAGAPGPDV